MKFRSTLILMAAIVLLVSERPVNASTYRLEPINSYYNIEVKYDEIKAFVGNRNLDLTVTMSTPASVQIPDSSRLALMSVESNEETRIKIKPLFSTARTENGGFVQTVYHYKIEILDGLEPRMYPLILKFSDPNNTGIQRYVDLFVGVRGKGKLRLVEASFAPVQLNSVVNIELKFANDYPDYTINIDAIEISSDPPDIIRRATLKDEVSVLPSQRGNLILLDSGLSIDPAQQRSVNIELITGGMTSAQQWLLGFGDSSKLKFEVSYNDGYGRKVSDFTTEANVKFKPRDSYLIFMLVVGLFCGTLLLLLIDYLVKKRVITKGGLLFFAASTLIVGFITAVVALVGQIQIVAFQKINLSYDVPGAIFVMGLAAAFGGTYFIRNWFDKSPARSK
ncbi:MAG TPA: hypothetical protein VF297_00740 [Pyrinomonadaceae bacterium]